MFLTGINEWRRETRGRRRARADDALLRRGRRARREAPAGGADAFDEYVSDPNRPVPFLGYIVGGMTSTT
jgi:predicted acyl esterase